MSRNIANAIARSLSIASVTLLMHVGTAAAAPPQPDFQREVSAVLAGNIANHSPSRASSTHADSADSKLDAQQFAQRLLLGWSTSHPARPASATQSPGPGTAAGMRQDSPAQGDIQSMVQRFLLGQRATARSAS